MKFQTKAKNLVNLYNRENRSFQVLPSLVLPAGDYFDTEIKQFVHEHNIHSLIVRSSSIREDSKVESNAGAFLSIPNVPCFIDGELNLRGIREAYISVVNSMPGAGNEVLLQPMLSNIKICGVAFSYDKDDLSPYYIIEYDDSGRSDTVTGGLGHTKRYTQLRGSHESSQLQCVIDALQELECIFSHALLDVEFAICDRLYILQVRPIATTKMPKEIDLGVLRQLELRLLDFNRPLPNIQGKRAIFGVMPDWNPAEIIGIRPERLALTLYRELVTDNIWAYQRSNYGYKDLRSHPLMHSFFGLPYIDVRLSFNSFVPKLLSDRISSKLVDYYLDKLMQNPHLHDKTEFEVVYNCYSLSTPYELRELRSHGFNDNEIKRIEFALLELTNNVLDQHNGLYKKDLQKIEILKDKYEDIVNSDMDMIKKIYWLTEDCKRFGTLPFAGIARAAFISMSILSSLVKIGFISQHEKEIFLNSLNTVSKQLSVRLYEVKIGKITRKEFLKEFGHLRAGTYNITSPRYDRVFDTYFNLDEISTPVNDDKLVLSADRMKKLDILLSESGLRIRANQLFDFITTCIEGREYAKFVFTKSLSQVIDILECIANENQISLDDFAHIDFGLIQGNYANLTQNNLREKMLHNIAKNKQEYELTKILKLPQLITSEKQVYAYHSTNVEPNFVGNKKVIADIALKENLVDCRDKIALIEAADPGYDFLFTKGIQGLVTCYGGTNSHMAIRCAELGLPACIGIGEEKFNHLKKARKIYLDCGRKILHAL